MKNPSTARLWLQEEFNRRRERNPAFSLRAFAQLLEIPPGRLSEILNQKRPMTVALVSRLAERLALDPRQRRQLLERLTLERQAMRPGRNTVSAQKDLVPGVDRPSGAGDGQSSSPHDFEQLSLDQFRVVADWYHFAILSLMEVADFQPRISWIAKRLGISTIQATSAIERLDRLGLIQRSDKNWTPTHRDLATPSDISSSALRRSHQQSLEQAINSLAEVPVELRDITSITMAIDLKKIPQAKELIREFRRRLGALLETDDRTEVYNLNIQLVPVTRPIKKVRTRRES